MSQRLIEFFAGGIRFGEVAGVAKFPGVRGEGGGAFDVFVEPSFEAGGLHGQFPNVVRLFWRDSVGNQKGFDGFFRGLLAMVDGGVERPILCRTENACGSQIVGSFGQP